MRNCGVTKNVVSYAGVVASVVVKNNPNMLTHER